MDACTIFVLTDAEHALFCNNEDWLNPKTQIWFVPARPDRFGCAYVGFNEQWAEGGLNTKGLAFDWVNFGVLEKWSRSPQLKVVRGNASERMLETCATVDDAIAFYKSHWEGCFLKARVLVADRSGASVIIYARDGILTVEKDNQCRGFGYGKKVLAKMLAQKPEPTVASGFNILIAARQPGKYATKYSNIYDLKSGDIYLLPHSGKDDMVKLNLGDELKKGSHLYDMPEIEAERTQPLRRPSQWKEWGKDIVMWYSNHFGTGFP